MLRLMLDSMGHDVRVAADGVQAVALAREWAPQIALLDIGMPGPAIADVVAGVRRAAPDAATWNRWPA